MTDGQTETLRMQEKPVHRWRCYFLDDGDSWQPLMEEHKTEADAIARAEKLRKDRKQPVRLRRGLGSPYGGPLTEQTVVRCDVGDDPARACPATCDAITRPERAHCLARQAEGKS